MEGKGSWPGFRCFGSAMVGSRGQVVIPASARKELGINTGTTLLVFIGTPRIGLTLLKADTVERIVSKVSEQLNSVEKILKNYAPPGAGSSRGVRDEKEA